MSKWLKVVLLWLLVGTMVWLLTLWHWQSNGTNPDLMDIVGTLLLLPSLIVVVWLLALWGVQRIMANATEPVHAQRIQTTAGTSIALADADLRQACAWVLDASMHTRAGLGAHTAWQTLKEGQTRADLDPHLQDLDGMPVFTARVPDLTVPIESELGAGEADDHSDALQRALALLEAPCIDLATTWSAMVDDLAQAIGASHSEVKTAEDVDWSAKAHLSGLAGQGVNATGRPELNALIWQVRVMVPGAWTKSEHSALLHAVQLHCRDAVDAALSMGVAEPRYQVASPDSPESWWAEFDAMLTRWTRESQVEACLMLAVDSAVTEQSVEQWQGIGELFTSRNQTGRVPGEAAVGMLVVSPALLDLLPVDALPQAPIRMARPVMFKRDKSADAAGRTGSSALTDALSQVMSAGQIEASDKLLVVSDGDHRASRTAELFEALQAVAPGLDPMLNVARSGEGLGDVGMARSLLSAALGCAAVWDSQGERVALAAHVQSSHDRVVLALSASPA